MNVENYIVHFKSSSKFIQHQSGQSLWLNILTNNQERMILLHRMFQKW